MAIGMMTNTGKSIISLMNILKEEKELFKRMFPFIVVELQDGIKYLGFYLKPNDYSKRDWGWMIDKVEKRLYVLCNK